MFSSTATLDLCLVDGYNCYFFQIHMLRQRFFNCASANRTYFVPFVQCS